MANDFLPFGIGVGSNVVSQAAWAALSARTAGFGAGIAQSDQLNKAWRQSSVMVAAIAQVIADRLSADVLDDGDLAALILQVDGAFAGGVDGVTNAMLAEMATGTVKANITGGSANPADVTLANLMAAFAAATTTTAGPVELATSGETQAGSDAVRAITPAGLFSFAKSLAASGYVTIPGTGLIVQWGRYAGGSASPSVSFPITFPSACRIVQITPLGTGSSTQAASTSVRVATLNGQPTTSGFSAYCSSENETSDVFEPETSCPFHWFALGE